MTDFQFPPPPHETEDPWDRVDYRQEGRPPDFQIPPPQSVDDSINEATQQVGQEIRAWRDGQLELQDRFDLMENLSGYANAFMSASPYINRNVWTRMQFDRRLGPPPKNATLGGNAITLAKGTWNLRVRVTHDRHDSGRVSVDIRVYYPNWHEKAGQIYSTGTAYGQVPNEGRATVAFTHPVVCPDPGYRAEVWSWNTVPGVGIYWKLLWHGGTSLSMFSAERQDLDASNAIVDENPPTEGESQGG